jgi:ABC-type dipeptide/oligopeptide/nickel transport system permease subunit
MTAQPTAVSPLTADILTAPARRAAARQWRILLPGLILIMLLGVALFGPLAAPYSPTVQLFRAGRLLPPGSPHHLLGTDGLARDLLSRLLVGTRMSLLVAGAAVAAGSIAGFVLGVICGYFRGPVDMIVMRVLDGLLAFPTLVLALVIAVSLGPGTRSAIIAIGTVSVPGFARLARAQTLQVGSSEYITAAKVMGAKATRIIRLHVIPNIWIACAAQAALALGYAIPAEATLSFLGLGVQLPTPSWGNMISDAFTTLATDPWPMVFPVVAVLITTLSASLLADGLAGAHDG